MNPLVIWALRLLLVLLFLGALLFQVLVPFTAADAGVVYPEVEHLVIPYAAGGIAALVCFQVAIAVVARLLSMVASGQVLTVAALRWVDAIAWCGAVAAAICLAVSSHMIFVSSIGGPAAAFLWLGSLVGGTAFVLLMMVMRGLLTAAIADRSELTEVI